MIFFLLSQDKYKRNALRSDFADIDFRELVSRILKYIFEGLIVAVAAYLIR
jgi:hypothetical protein